MPERDFDQLHPALGGEAKAGGLTIEFFLLMRRQGWNSCPLQEFVDKLDVFGRQHGFPLRQELLDQRCSGLVSPTSP